MRQLTFRGFTKKYVKELSLSKTSAIYQLVREATTTNRRLKEPLYLYAASNGCLSTLLMASRKTNFYSSYQELSERFSYPELLEALKQKSAELPDQYLKVWTSFCSVKSMPERDARVKDLMATKIVRMQSTLGIGTYRICKDLSLNNANINCWLKNKQSNKVSLKNARRVLKYLEDAESC